MTKRKALTPQDAAVVRAAMAWYRRFGELTLAHAPKRFTPYKLAKACARAARGKRK